MLTDFLLRRFVPGREQANRLKVRSRVGQLEAWVSIVVNTLLSAVKMILGLMVNSISLIADAVHTISDVATSAVVLFGFKISGKPADKEHPFGHGRAEYVATLVIAVMLGVVGFEFIKSAIGRLITPVPIKAGWGVLAAIFATVLVKFWLGLFSSRLGKLIESSTLKADAWHHHSDAISSLLVLAAIGGSTAGYPAMDGIGGILVGGYLIWSAVTLIKDIIDPLMGAPPSPELLQKIRDLSRKEKAVIDVHDIEVHHYGQGRYLSLHAEVNARLSTQEAHDVAENLTERLQNELGAYSTVHIDPIEPESEEVHRISVLLDGLLSQSEVFTGYHDLRVLKTPKYQSILFEINTVPEASDDQQQATLKWLKREVLKVYPGARVQIQVAPIHAYP